MQFPCFHLSINYEIRKIAEAVVRLEGARKYIDVDERRMHNEILSIVTNRLRFIKYMVVWVKSSGQDVFSILRFTSYQ